MTPGMRQMLARALALHRAGELAQAMPLYREVLALDPRQPDALQLLGAAELQAGRPAVALTLFDAFVAAGAAVPPELHGNRAAALRELGRGVEALAELARALALRPGDAKALSNRAATLLDLGRADEALPSIEAALALDPRDAAAWHNRAGVLMALGHPAEALAACDAALALAPDRAASHCQRGNALLELGRPEEALSGYARARALAPQTPFLLGQWLLARLAVHDWDRLEAAFGELARGIVAGAPVAAPFVALHAPLDAGLQRQCARTFARQRHPPVATRPVDPPPRADGRIRIGVFSADLREHPTAILAAGVFERFDRRRFELSAFVFGPPADDPMARRVQAAFGHVVDVRALHDAAVAALARERGIEIALDLGGYTRHARPGIFAARAAPLQIGWLGYPGTTGSPALDYLVADATVAPFEQAEGFDERLIHLPHSYQPNDRSRPPAAPTPARTELGLPEEGVVFCAFHQAAKITPDVFALWLRLLRRCPGSVLWQLDPGAAAQARLRAAVHRAGIDPARLVFAPRLPLAAHLARLPAADLALDTLHYGGHTSTSDALWAGLPVLTRLGATFASRVAASLLRAVGLGELVCVSVEAYEALAIELAHAPQRRAALRARLAAARDTAPLFDAARFTRALEAACSAAWQRHQRGLAPCALQVREDTRGDLVVVEHAAVPEAARGVQPRPE